MNNEQVKFLDQLGQMSVEECGKLDAETIHETFSDLLKMIDVLETRISLKSPVGMNQVIRIQGAHDSLIPQDKEDGGCGPVIAGC